jgi:type IV secretory pathway TraG/TraD family ATPase VirD4
MPSLLACLLFVPSLAICGAAGAWLGNILHHPRLGLAGGAIAAFSAFMGWGGKQRLQDGSLWAPQDYSPWEQVPHALVVLAAMTACGWLGYGIGGFIGEAWNGNRQPLIGQTWGMVAGSLGAWVYLMQDKELVGHPKVLGTEYGIARFLEFSEALKAGTSLNPTGGLYLGQVRLWVQKKRKKLVQELFRLAYTGDISALVVSPAGGGKFSCSLCPTLLTNQDDHIIVFDPTGQAAAVTGGSVVPGAKAWRREGLKRRVVVINPFNILGHILQKSASVNPLAEIDQDSPTFESDMRGIAAIIQPVHAAETNRFFSESSRELLAAMLMHTRSIHGKAATLPMVNDALQQSEPYLNETVFKAMIESVCPAVRHIGNQYYLPQGAERSKGAKDVLATAKTAMAWLSDSVMQRLFSQPDFSWKELKRQTPERLTVYIVWPSNKGADHAKAAELLLSTALDTLLDYPTTPVLMLVDEMANALQKKGRGIDLIRRGFAEGRKYGVRVVGVLQNWGQLIALAGEEDATTLAANAGITVFFGAAPGDHITADYICKTAGQQGIWQPSQDKPVVVAADGGAEFIGWQPSTSNATGVPLLHPQMLPEINRNGQLLAFLGKSGFPLLMDRFPHYFQVKELAARADPDPFHESGNATPGKVGKP